MRCALGSHHRSCKAIREDLAIARGMVPSELLKDYVVSALRIRRPIPRTVENDEYSIAIAGWKLFLVVMHHSVRSPMGGKYRSRGQLVRAHASRLASVTAIFRSQHQLLLEGIVVALGPAIITAGPQKHHFCRGQRGFLICLIEVRPVGM